MGMSGREWVRHGWRGAAAKICGVAASLSRWLAVPCIRNPRDIRPPRPGFDVWPNGCLCWSDESGAMGGVYGAGVFGARAAAPI